MIIRTAKPDHHFVPKDRPTSEESYRRFISRAVSSGKVYGLRDRDDGWAVCPSQDDEQLDVILFWSDRADAAKHAKAEWAGNMVIAISLEEFIGAWLRGMHQDGALVGPNWDSNLCGLEIEAIEMAKALTENEDLE